MTTDRTCINCHERVEWSPAANCWVHVGSVSRFCDLDGVRRAVPTR